MGFDCGFDIYPRLEASIANKQTYQRFLDEIINTYDGVYDADGRRADGKVLEIPIGSDQPDKVYIRFMVGECPHLPRNPARCNYFLRFSSKISGCLTTPAEPYIRNVHEIAKKHFGNRVHFWHEMNETGDERQWGYYNWREVHDASEKLRELETGQGEDLQNRTLEDEKGTNDERSVICGCLYTVQEIPGKGHGLLAATAITKGTRILSEFPLFRVSRGGNSKTHLRDTVSRKVTALQEQQRQAFFSLHNSFEDEDGPELGRVRTNALPLGSDATIGGIFLNSSRINHSCNPNAQNTWNENLQQLTIHAMRDIAKGDEITIFYLTARRNRSARLHALQTSFHFTCSCSLCSPPLAQGKMSDERLDEIARLDNSIGDGVGISFAPLQTLHDVHKLLNLLDDEGIADASVPRAYYDAFQIAIAHGDIARAGVFAERAASSRVILEGNDSPTVQRMESLARDPSQHMAYGLSGKWRTARDDTPKTLGKDEFERWLWKKEIAEVSQYADLRSDTEFPPFDDLPGENDISLEFYETKNGFSYRPRKHWCFLAEIIEVETFIRMKLVVKDKTDRELPVAFHTDDRGLEQSPYVQQGFTVAILYAEQHGFLDLSMGIRHENPAAIKIFPLPLSDLFTLNDKVQQYATEMKGARTCQGCNQKSAALKKCSRCGLFWYCNQSCQIAGWNEKGHKKDCKRLKDPDLRRLFLMKWNIFEDYYRFGQDLSEKKG